jgi:hypothetical protein
MYTLYRLAHTMVLPYLVHRTHILSTVLTAHDTYGEKKNIPNRFCKQFGLQNDEKIHMYLMKLSNNNNSDPGFSYGTVMNTQRYIIRSGITQPRQFSLGNIPTMSGITDSIFEGWDTRKISKYFNKENNIANQQESSHDYIKKV